jgi:hypothetical protein
MCDVTSLLLDCFVVALSLTCRFDPPLALVVVVAVVLRPDGENHRRQGHPGRSPPRHPTNVSLPLSPCRPSDDRTTPCSCHRLPSYLAGDGGLRLRGGLQGGAPVAGRQAAGDRRGHQRSTPQGDATPSPSRLFPWPPLSGALLPHQAPSLTCATHTPQTPLFRTWYGTSRKAAAASLDTACRAVAAVVVVVESSELRWGRSKEGFVFGGAFVCDCRVRLWCWCLFCVCV